MVSKSSKGVNNEMYCYPDELCFTFILRPAGQHTHIHTHAQVHTHSQSRGSVLGSPSCPQQLNVLPDLAGCALHAGVLGLST